MGRVLLGPLPGLAQTLTNNPSPSAAVPAPVLECLDNGQLHLNNDVLDDFGLTQTEARVLRKPV